MRDVIITVLYMVSAVLFIRGIKLLGKADTARKGNGMSAVGMLIAVVTVLFEKQVMDAGMMSYLMIAGAVIVGSIIGAVWAKKVEMTGMPQLVALFNGFGGLSSLLVALAQYANYRTIGADAQPFEGITMGLTVAIGAIAFTGSVVAWGKLSGKLFKKSVTIPAKNALNAVLAIAGLAGVCLYAFSGSNTQLGFIGIIMVTAAYLILGFTMVVTIGGGDMPVIISLLNAFSGLAAAFAGLAISNSVLVVSGCLVGTSGLILTLIMCKAMNRTLYSLLFGSFGATKSKGAAGSGKEPKAMSVEDAYLILEAASSVVFVPGYGMAVAQAQHSVKELADKLEANGAEVSFAIHPVAGRMPGHMNVLLAEANVPYEQLKTADEMNPQMANTDVAIIIGANDVVNPSALTDESSPLYGMPIINAYEARTVFVLKRGKGTGFSGVENPLFTNDNTVMIYGDAKQTVSQLVSEFEES
ncbi:MAG: NAD(P)(+) transhydrogenase (Re/Si-specific) subunit beta [Oscillospiraceae bacterium]|nr:NAD(P)(+) transhydrogenase (Re/Si-specific) subunit beta [Oscillospiraceae bacterium]